MISLGPQRRPRTTDHSGAGFVFEPDIGIHSNPPRDLCYRRDLALNGQGFAELGRTMLDQPLQHVDVAFGADPTVDTRMNGEADVKRRIHIVAEHTGVDPAGLQSLGLGLSRCLYDMGLILKTRNRFVPNSHAASSPYSKITKLSRFIGTYEFRRIPSGLGR